MSLVFYDKKGKPIAYCDDGETIYLLTGRPICYITSDAVFSFEGKHLGWFENGWIANNVEANLS